MFIAETGSENRIRASWLRYVCEETQAAIEAGVPVEGMCLYPILNHPGWNDGRHCHNALWDYADANGEREIYEPLARELRRWQKVFAQERRTGVQTVATGKGTEIPNVRSDETLVAAHANFDFQISEL